MADCKNGAKPRRQRGMAPRGWFPFANDLGWSGQWAGMSDAARAVYPILGVLAGSGESSASAAMIARLSGKAPSTVHVAIGELILAGLVSQTQRGGGVYVARYRVPIPFIADTLSDASDTTTPASRIAPILPVGEYLSENGHDPIRPAGHNIYSGIQKQEIQQQQGAAAPAAPTPPPAVVAVVKATEHANRIALGDVGISGAKRNALASTPGITVARICERSEHARDNGRGTGLLIQDLEAHAPGWAQRDALNAQRASITPDDIARNRSKIIELHPNFAAISDWSDPKMLPAIRAACAEAQLRMSCKK